MRWYRDAFCEAEHRAAEARGVDAYTVMEAAAAAVPPGSNGLIAILSNVMNARRWVHASPSFLGFDIADPVGSGRAAGVRAIEEAAAFVVRGHRDIVAELTGLTFEEAVFTGGAAKGLLWPQILADVLARPVHVPYVKESSALGAALCAGVGVGLYPSLTRLPASLAARERTFVPSPDAVAAYDRAYDRWKRIYDAVLPLSEQGLVRPLWRAAGADALA
jgi:autoinducer 2 (AI-2) kinase